MLFVIAGVSVAVRLIVRAGDFTSATTHALAFERIFCACFRIETDSALVTETILFGCLVTVTTAAVLRLRVFCACLMMVTTSDCESEKNFATCFTTMDTLIEELTETFWVKVSCWMNSAT